MVHPTYEPEENRTHWGKSAGGRAVHSVYVQILSDLGLAGMLIFLTAVLSSIRGNGQKIQALRGEFGIIRRLTPLLDTDLDIGSGPSMPRLLSEF